MPKVLYHVTTEESLPAILAERKLRPRGTPGRHAFQLDYDNVYFADNAQDALRMSGEYESARCLAAALNLYYSAHWQHFHSLVAHGPYKWAKFAMYSPALVIPTDWIGAVTARPNPETGKPEYLHKGDVVLPDTPEVIQVKSVTMQHVVHVDHPTEPIIFSASPQELYDAEQIANQVTLAVCAFKEAFDRRYPDLSGKPIQPDCPDGGAVARLPG